MSEAMIDIAILGLRIVITNEPIGATGAVVLLLMLTGAIGFALCLDLQGELKASKAEQERLQEQLSKYDRNNLELPKMPEPPSPRTQQ